MLFAAKVGGTPSGIVGPERKKELQAFEKAIATRFRNLGFLNLAFSHRSYGNEVEPGLGSNERLEFLGDSVLGLVVADWLFQNLVDRPEGDLARIKSYVVSEDSLSEIALGLGVDRYLLLGKGEEMSGGRQKKAILADALEAIIGALYLDQGLAVVRIFVLTHMVPRITEVLENRHRKDYKTLLQEFTQRTLKAIPRYVCIAKTGPDHAKIFEYEVHLGDKVWGPARGSSKKEAEQGAAALAWQDLEPDEGWGGI